MSFDAELSSFRKINLVKLDHDLSVKCKMQKDKTSNTGKHIGDPQVCQHFLMQKW